MEALSEFELVFYRGRVALYACLKALGVGQGDEVAIQSFTCLAVPEAIMATRATPLYIDVSANTVTMSPTDLAARITPKTKVIVVQHTFGIPTDMAAVMEIAQQHGIPVIEDCAHTLAAEYQGKAIGSFGVASFYSFEWGKPLIAGIGGALVVNDRPLKTKIAASYEEYAAMTGGLQHRIQFSLHSILYRPAFYWPIKRLFHALSKTGLAVGNYNAIDGDDISADFSRRMTDFHYKKLVTGLKTLDEDTRHSHTIARRYRDEISAANVRFVEVPDNCRVTYARFPLLVEDKDGLLALAAKKNVELASWYATPVHPLTESEWSLVHYRGDCPVTESLVNQVVSLPTNKKVDRRSVEKAVDLINSWNGSASDGP